MDRRLAAIPAALLLAVVIAVALPLQDADVGPEGQDADVVMPVKSSRPACGETDSCYVPSEITVTAGRTVTWMNDDVAFHSVTSGSYGAPEGLFDSGHMDPGELFEVRFAEPGTFDYFCTLHPWMHGTVTVREVREGVEPP